MNFKRWRMFFTEGATSMIEDSGGGGGLWCTCNSKTKEILAKLES